MLPATVALADHFRRPESPNECPPTVNSARHSTTVPGTAISNAPLLLPKNLIAENPPLPLPLNALRFVRKAFAFPLQPKTAI